MMRSGESMECLLTPTSFERDCAVPISAIKQQLILYEQQGMRLPVYRYLKDLWNTSFRTEDLTVLIIQQMMFYLIELESPWVKWEAEDEHQTYQIFLKPSLMSYQTTMHLTRIRAHGL